MRSYLKSLIFIIAIAPFFKIAVAQTPQFYFQNNTTGSNSIPFGGSSWADQRNQWFWAPGDFGKSVYSGLITTIYLKHGTTVTAATWTNLKISMGQPNITGLTTAWVTGLTQVYFNPAHSQPAGVADQWFSITLQTPFSYNPSLPLVVETIQTGTSGGKSLRAGGTPIDPTYTGNTQTYAASGAASGTTRRYSYAFGFDLTSPYYNDAGISSITQPAGNITAGIDTVKATVSNLGMKNLISANLGWSVDNMVQAAPAPWSGSLPQFGISVPVTIGTFNFSVGVHTIKVWTSSANGISPDSNSGNDTAITKIMACASLLNGNYTIGPKPSDFLTFNDALMALGNCGISGPVKFTVKSGTYNERLVVTQVPNASFINTITFDGLSPDSVKVTWAGTSSAYSTIYFNGADYFVFKNMTVENTGNTYANALCLGNTAENNTFENIKFYVDQSSTSSTVNNIIASSAETSASGTGNNANYTAFSNCLIKGGYYGMRLNGTSSATKCFYNSVINCVFDKQYYYGIYFYYQDHPSIINNIVDGLRYTSSYGIYNYYGGTGGKIIGNYIVAKVYGLYHNYCSASRIEQNTIRAGYMGMYVYQESNSSDSTTIFNNMIQVGGNTSYSYGYGLYLYYATKTLVYHNTIQTDTTYSSPTSYGAIRTGYGNGGIKIKNNILRCFGNLPNISSDMAGIAAGDIDYNIYYTKIQGNLIAYWGTSSFTSLAAWKLAVPAHNMNSMSFEPMLKSKYNQHLSPLAPFYRGISLGVAVDADNEQRCIPVPTIGADEYEHPYVRPDVDFHVDSAICINSPYTFLNKAGLNEPKMHYWFLNNVPVSTEVNWTTNFTSTGSYMVKLVTRSCSAIDTVEKNVNVGLATQPPVSYFILNKNLAEVYETVTFSDLSSNCPESWKWHITPDSIFDPALGYKIPTYSYINGNDASRSPQVAFLVSGIYTICLTTANVQGTGTTYCLNNYLEIMPTATLCALKTDSKSSYGTLYDDGGFSLPYSANKACDFYIHPCATSVSLVFSSFDIAPGDYIKIYDGSNEKGIPLWNSVLFPDGLSNNTVIPSPYDTFVSNSGKIYMVFKTDGNTQNAGFAASWSSVDGNFPKPTVYFAVADTVCNGIPVNFMNMSTGEQNEYFWDYENDGVIDAVTTDGAKTYGIDGFYAVKLAVSGCGGSDTFIKNIYVNTSGLPPSFEIMTSNVKPNAQAEIVTVSENTLMNCVDSTVWFITPLTYTLLSGSLSNSYSLNMKFNDTVCYDFTVIGKYHGLSDTVFYPCFIKPVLFCEPIVNNLTTDLGISRVVLNTIDNTSKIGQNQYTDYTNDFYTDVERGTTTPITLYRNTSYNPMNRKVWVDLNRDGIFNAVNELSDMEGSSFSLNWTGGLKIPVSTGLGFTRVRIGTALAGSSNMPCGINNFGEFEDYKINIIKDITKPVITLLGSSQMHISQCTPAFVDPGVIVTDNVDTTLTDSVMVTGSVNTYLPGSYTITYEVKDAEGNLALPVVREVIVDEELVPPEISLVGPQTATIQVYSSYVDSGYIANDTCSGLDKVDMSTNLDTSLLGSYEMKYTAFDMVGNAGSISRTINVTDTISPVITSISNDTIILEVYHILARPLYAASDNYYKTVDVEMTGDYYVQFPSGQADKLGYYILTYLASDGSGNTSTLDFVIHVVDNEKPVLVLNGNEFITICRFDTLTEPGFVLNDNYDPYPVLIKSGTYISDYLVNRNVGYYEIVYTATDHSGNKSVASRFVIVTDTGDCYSSIRKPKEETGVLLYPNPGQGRYILSLPTGQMSAVDVEMINSLGEVVYWNTFEMIPGEMITVDCRELKAGIYLIRVTVDGKQFFLKYNLVK